MYAAIGISYELVIILGHFTWGAPSSSRMMSRLPASIMISLRSPIHSTPIFRPTGGALMRAQEMTEAREDPRESKLDVKHEEQMEMTCSDRTK